MQNYIVKTARLMGKIGLRVLRHSKTLSVTHNKKKEESVKNSSNFTHVKWLKKYINTITNMILYFEKIPDACGSGHQKNYSL